MDLEILSQKFCDYSVSIRGYSKATVRRYKYVNGLKKLVWQVRESSGIYFSVHKLRHTFATLMLEGGCDIYSLSKMMGHSDIKTTTIYLSASAEHLRSQMTKHPLNELIMEEVKCLKMFSQHSRSK